MNKNEALNYLNLQGNPSDDDIKKAYRVLAKKYHPDANLSNKKECEEKFKKLQEAYSFLVEKQENNNSQSRHHPFEDIMSGSMFENMFNDFMFSNGGKRAHQRERLEPRPNPSSCIYRLPDVDMGNYLTVSLFSALFGEEISIKLQLKEHCKSCLQDPSFWSPCRTCNQLGIIETSVKTNFGIISQHTECSSCRGKGWKPKSYCTKCHSKLILPKIKEIKFSIPINYKLGSKIKLENYGNENWNCLNSDLYLEPRIEIPDMSKLSKEEKEYILKLFS